MSKIVVTTGELKWDQSAMQTFGPPAPLEEPETLAEHLMNTQGILQRSDLIVVAVPWGEQAQDTELFDRLARMVRDLAQLEQQELG